MMVETATRFFRSHLWLAFLLHQGLIFGLALLFLTSVRTLTNRAIHGGRDPVALVDGTVLIALSITVIVLTQLLYRWLRGKDAVPLGIALTPRRLIDLLIGFSVSFAIVILPWVIALWRGTASIHDRIGAHFGGVVVARLVSVAILLLLVQSITEETANRAFPIRLWDKRSIIFRILIPSFFFAVIHFAGEQLSIERIGVLMMGGILQSFAYLLTGDIWFTSGVHTGANFAAFSIGGLWHAGAIVALVGLPAFPNWVAVMLMLVVMSAAWAVLRWYRVQIDSD